MLDLLKHILDPFWSPELPLHRLTVRLEAFKHGVPLRSLTDGSCNFLGLFRLEPGLALLAYDHWSPTLRSI